MAVFSDIIDAHWCAPLVRGEVVVRSDRLTVVSDPALPDDRPVTIITMAGGPTIAALSPSTAASVTARTISDEPGLRQALTDAHVSLHPADALFYVSLAAMADLLSEPDDANVRPLTEHDRELFDAFTSVAPAEDLDNAYVELDHWAVFGALRDGELACAASMYPWGDSELADLGVITLPDARRRGLGRSVVRACLRYAYRQGREPQYRCQLDNAASLALAAAAGLARYGDWEVAT